MLARKHGGHSAALRGAPAARAERFRAFPSAPEAQRNPGSRAGGSRPARSLGAAAPARGEGRPDVSGAAISCFSAVFLSFGWWPLPGFSFQSAEGEAAWTAAPAPHAPPPAAARPPARRFPRPPLLVSALGRYRGLASGPDAGHQVCGGGRRVSAGGPGAAGWAREGRGRRGLRAAPGCRARVAAAGLAGRWLPASRAAARAWFRRFGGGGLGRSGPEGKVNSTLRFLPGRTPPALVGTKIRRAWRWLSLFPLEEGVLFGFFLHL